MKKTENFTHNIIKHFPKLTNKSNRCQSGLRLGSYPISNGPIPLHRRYVTFFYRGCTLHFLGNSGGFL